MLQLDTFVVSYTGSILVPEYYMEEVLRREGFIEIDDKYGTDSNLVCEYAVHELGFKNLGDFGYGFIFFQEARELDEWLIERYFKDKN